MIQSTEWFCVHYVRLSIASVTYYVRHISLIVVDSRFVKLCWVGVSRLSTLGDIIVFCNISKIFKKLQVMEIGLKFVITILSPFL